MRTVLLVLCALLMMGATMEAKKVKVKTPASQKAFAKQHKKALKQMQKSRKAPKHHQRVN
jgi:biopolymer transport protein ExbD